MFAGCVCGCPNGEVAAMPAACAGPPEAGTNPPASLEYLNTDVGVAWFIVPLISFVLVGLNVHCLLRIKRERRGAAAS